MAKLSFGLIDSLLALATHGGANTLLFGLIKNGSGGRWPRFRVGIAHRGFAGRHGVGFVKDC